MFERILLAIDDSPGSEMALAFASGLARRCDAAIHVLHVNEYLVAGGGTTLHTREEALALVSTATDALRAQGVPTSASVRTANYRDVARSIADAAHQRQSGAIVLGSRRQRRLGRLFSPNVRERVTRLTALPVLTAPSPLLVPRQTDLSFGDLVERELELTLTVPPAGSSRL